MKKLIAVAAALMLALGLCCTAFAEGTTIRAMPATINMENLTDRFVTTDIAYKGDGRAELTLYEIERFEGTDLKAARPGDMIESEGETIAIESVEWDGPDLYFNRGTDQEMLFCSYEDVIFERVIREENDRNTMVKIGTMETEIMPYMTMLDWIDAGTGEVLEDMPALRDGEELVKLLEQNADPGFASLNVRILYDNMNKPNLIWRYDITAE